MKKLLKIAIISIDILLTGFMILIIINDRAQIDLLNKKINIEREFNREIKKSNDALIKAIDTIKCFEIMKY